MAKAKPKKSKGLLGRAASLLGSIPAVGNVRNAAKKVGKAKKTIKKTVKKATKTAKKVVKSSKKKVTKTLKKKKKKAAKLKKGLKKAKKKVKRKAKKKLRKKVGKVFTKARKLKNNLSKNKRVQKLKKKMKKTVLKAKKGIKKAKETAKKVSKAVVKNTKKVMKKTTLAVKSFTENGFNGKEVASAIVDFIPIVGNAKAAYETTFGKDPITGRKLDKAERIATGAAIIGGPLVKGGTRGVRLVSGILPGQKKIEKLKPKSNAPDKIYVKEVTVKYKVYKENPEEFKRQLAGQEKGLNKLTAGEIKSNIEKFKESGRPKIANSTIRKVRRQNPEAAKGKAALHEPDTVIGGHPDKILDFGDLKVNSSLGSQNRTRQEQFYNAVKDVAPDKKVKFKLEIEED